MTKSTKNSPVKTLLKWTLVALLSVLVARTAYFARYPSISLGKTPSIVFQGTFPSEPSWSLSFRLGYAATNPTCFEIPTLFGFIPLVNTKVPRQGIIDYPVEFQNGMYRVEVPLQPYGGPCKWKIDSWKPVIKINGVEEVAINFEDSAKQGFKPRAFPPTGKGIVACRHLHKFNIEGWYCPIALEPDNEDKDNGLTLTLDFMKDIK